VARRFLKFVGTELKATWTLTKQSSRPTEEAKATALKVLLNNVKGPHKGLPRTAAGGYPEPAFKIS